jgi:assimilatory nitrate reductase catalytic subunit
MLHVITEGLTDEAFIAARTNGWEETRAVAMRYTPHRPEITGVSPKDRRPPGFTDAQKMACVMLVASSITPMVSTTCSYINLVLASGKIGVQVVATGLSPDRNGQGGREHGQKATSFPANARSRIPNTAGTSATFGMPEEELPQAGVSVVEMFQKMREW